MALFQLTLFYQKAKSHEAQIRGITKEIKSLADDDNWRLLSAGEQVCAIVFESAVEPKILEKRFQPYGHEQFQYVLIKISSVVGACISEDKWSWLNSRLLVNQGRH